MRVVGQCQGGVGQDPGVNGGEVASGVKARAGAVASLLAAAEERISRPLTDCDK